ncbi:MAG: DUF2961 domain-containing protein [Bacteroidota bacterium]|jgi:hypothetical protein|nr:DUF2961 domain-containing protein [Bacteroidota bacterium]HHU97784.1 DUF2961 domain-containing protein [Petrimonas sp.]
MRKLQMKKIACMVMALTSLFTTRAQNLYQAPDPSMKTRWVSPENPTGEPGKGGMTNKGAKGNAFFIISPGEIKTIFDVKGAGIINRMWLSGTIGTNASQRRAVRIDMYWDGSEKPAVSAPIGDFFGIAHGLIAKYDNELFQSPEARSFNFTIPMPFRQSAFITVTNESQTELWLWYDINYTQMDKLPKDAMYFHAYWHRDLKTKPGVDFEIMPEVYGVGRYLGTNIGVIGDSLTRGTWFGEGEVKIYLDGDTEFPTLVGTGTEDYIGTGWGQNEFVGRYFGSPISKREDDIYAFYRYHINDPVYFHQNCKVTIQQMGNSSKEQMLKMREKGANIIPIWALGQDKGKTYQRRLLDEEDAPKLEDDSFPETSTHFWRSDDVCATVYFYLNKPESNLPELAPVYHRLIDLEERVWMKIK